MMPAHVKVPEVYFLVTAIALGQTAKGTPPTEATLEAIWQYIFGEPIAADTGAQLGGKVRLCGDAMVTIFCMVRAMLNDVDGEDQPPAWLANCPVTLTQFVCYLYHNAKDFMTVFMTDEVLKALVGTIFPRARHWEEEEGGHCHGGSEQDNLREALSQHPARRSIINFMRSIIVDSLSLPPPPSPKMSPVIDLLLNSKPDGSTHGQRCR